MQRSLSQVTSGTFQKSDLAGDPSISFAESESEAVLSVQGKEKEQRSRCLSPRVRCCCEWVLALHGVKPAGLSSTRREPVQLLVHKAQPSSVTRHSSTGPWPSPLLLPRIRPRPGSPKSRPDGTSHCHLHREVGSCRGEKKTLTNTEEKRRNWSCAPCR